MTNAINILIADDDADIWAGGLKRNLQDLPHVNIATAYSPADCKIAVARQQFEIVLVDISFSLNDTSGLALVQDIQEAQKNAKIFMVSNHDDDATMVRSLRAGALDFISKRQTDSLGLSKILRSYIAGKKKRASDEDSGREIAAAIGAVAVSQSMLDVFTKVAIARQNPATPVLITGETGTGKEIIATALSAGNRSRPFISVDCGAIPETLAESEFFGHVKGAFTGADSAKRGKFQLADNGDLFLDEIGNLKRSTQEKLLRAIQSKEVTPVGGSTPTKVNTRIVAATNENLDQLVASGQFRQDLLERIRGIWIQLPPLRERPDEIEPLIRRIIQFSAKPGLTVAPTCLSLLRRYSWPGNIRELGNVIREMIASVDEGPLTLRHLPEHFAERLTSELSSPDVGGEPAVPSVSLTVPTEVALAEANDRFLAQYLKERIKLLGKLATKAKLARDLQISRTTLGTYLKRLQIDLEEGAAE